MLKGKTIVLGVTGGIAAYKIASLASMLVKQRAEVHVILTENGSKFITPHTFEALTHTRCLIDTFDRGHSYEVEHVELAKKADMILIAPATANTIGKMAAGIADNMLLTTIMAARCKVAIAPAMNTGMYENLILQKNLQELKEVGMDIIEPVSGYLACKDIGQGKMVEPEVLFEHICNQVSCEKDMLDKKILITAGPTIEKIDPVRYISNHSTGKMGYALAKMAVRRGAEVTLISGKTNLDYPIGTLNINVTSAQEMYDATMENYKQQDIIIMTAAVADYKVKNVSDEKIKKKNAEISLELESTKDILMELGSNKKESQFLCGFAMETQNLEENAMIKFKKKKLDLLVANDLKEEGAGFGKDTNVITLISTKSTQKLPLLSKENVATEILNEIMKQSDEKTNS